VTYRWLNLEAIRFKLILAIKLFKTQKFIEILCLKELKEVPNDMCPGF